MCVGSDIVEASLRGRFKQGQKKKVLVGDRIVMDAQANGAFTIEEIEERHCVLKRRSPGKGRGVREIAANIDQVVVVGSARDPMWNPHLIDRFLAVAEANGLSPSVVINKCDLSDDVKSFAAPYETAGYEVLFTSVRDRRGLKELGNHLAGRISMLNGPTGVGKSSLLNALQPGLKLRTAPISMGTRAGRHTTVAAEMLRFGESGFVVDTPGLRDIGLWGLEPDEVADAFPEFAEFALECRFDNCRHLEEPSCGVKDAIEKGKLALTRHGSYRTMLEEATKAARPWL